LALPALEALGFDPKAVDSDGVFVLTVIYSLAPVVIKTMAIAIMWRFPIDADRHAVIRRRLARTESAQQHRAGETPG